MFQPVSIVKYFVATNTHDAIRVREDAIKWVLDRCGGYKPDKKEVIDVLREKIPACISSVAPEDPCASILNCLIEAARGDISELIKRDKKYSVIWYNVKMCMRNEVYNCNNIMMATFLSESNAMKIKTIESIILNRQS